MDMHAYHHALMAGHSESKAIEIGEDRAMEAMAHRQAEAQIQQSTVPCDMCSNAAVTTSHGRYICSKECAAKASAASGGDHD